MVQPMTIAEKILARAAGKSEVTPGEYLIAKIDLLMAHIAAARIVARFMGFPAKVRKVFDTEKVVVLEDHFVPAPTVFAANAQKMIREWAFKMELKYFYDIKFGICHQVLPEKGHVRPGMLIVGTDSHTTTYGAYNAAGTGIGDTDGTVAAALGELWFKVPETIRFVLDGQLPKYVMSKDIILKIAGDHKADVACYKSIEFIGKAATDMSLSSRATLSNFSMELGAKFAFTPPDNKILEFLKGRTDKPFELVKSDEKAGIEKIYELNVSELEPHVACPHTIDNVKPVSDLKDVEVQQAFIGSCTNGRLEDLKIAAEILKGRKVNKKTRLLVIPATQEVYKDAIKAGIIETLIDAEAIICNPNCGPCFGAHMGMLAPKENCISASNRNFKGRMGSEDAGIYLASPAVVAASAITGVITDPRTL
ncbi:MAG TPA: 3-isopropylmalate dehydratase large subunit [Candidatus Deferrimicrobium sp.]|nr:3-isopropylmalate dehydratase large subunit [Candidatus Deferrimicrobium sp.]